MSGKSLIVCGVSNISLAIFAAATFRQIIQHTESQSEECKDAIHRVRRRNKKLREQLEACQEQLDLYEQAFGEPYLVTFGKSEREFECD